MGVKRAVMRWSRDDGSRDRPVSPPDSRLGCACCREAFQGARKINHTILRDKLLRWSHTGVLCLLGTLAPLSCVSLLAAACRCPLWGRNK